jgi:hypothetical protein
MLVHLLHPGESVFTAVQIAVPQGGECIVVVVVIVAAVYKKLNHVPLSSF